MTSPLPALNGLTAADVPAQVTAEAARPSCCPEAPSITGFGYYGGGFGAYRRCLACGKPFAKSGSG